LVTIQAPPTVSWCEVTPSHADEAIIGEGKPISVTVAKRVLKRGSIDVAGDAVTVVRGGVDGDVGAGDAHARGQQGVGGSPY
jgi:hypothetical protein